MMLSSMTLKAMVLVGICNVRKLLKGLVRGFEKIELVRQRGCPRLEERAPVGYGVVVDLGWV